MYIHIIKGFIDDMIYMDMISYDVMLMFHKLMMLISINSLFYFYFSLFVFYLTSVIFVCFFLVDNDQIRSKIFFSFIKNIIAYFYILYFLHFIVYIYQSSTFGLYLSLFQNQKALELPL